MAERADWAYYVGEVENAHREGVWPPMPPDTILADQVLANRRNQAIQVTQEQQERTKQVYFDIVHETSPQEQFFQALLDGRVILEPERPIRVEYDLDSPQAYRVVVEPVPDAGA